MKILQLVSFTQAYNCKSISKAAELLHITQPAISQAIKELEKEFEIDLLIRKNNKYELTPEGMIFYDHAQAVLNEVDLLYKQMRDLKEDPVAHFGIASLVGNILLPAIYQEFEETFPTLKLDIKELNSIPLLQAVEDNVMDLALVPIYKLDGNTFDHIKLASIDLVFCTNKLNALSQNSVLDLTTIKNEPLILPCSDSIENSVIMDYFAENNIEPNVILYSNQLHTIDHVINHDIASSILYKTLIHRRQGVIIPIPLSKPIFITIGLVWKKGKYLHRNACKLIDFLKNASFKYIYDNLKPVKEKDNLIPSR